MERRLAMNKFLAGAAALAALAATGFTGAAHAQGQCVWSGNHWDCGDRAVYPKFYPHGTIVGDHVLGTTPVPPPPSPADIYGTAPPANGQRP
jgi:hypothetical protein